MCPLAVVIGGHCLQGATWEMFPSPPGTCLLILLLPPPAGWFCLGAGEEQVAQWGTVPAA